MTKPHHNLRVFLFILLFCAANMIFIPVGNVLEDIPFAFGMIQLTIFTVLVSMKYEMLASEIKKLGKQLLMNVILFFVCCILFSIVTMTAYLKLLGTSIMVSIQPNLSIQMFSFLVVTVLFVFATNEAFLIQILKSLVYKQNEQNKLMIGLAIYVLLRSILFFFINPEGIVVGIAFTLITGFCAVMLIYKNKSLFLYPLAVMAIGTLFALI